MEPEGSSDNGSGCFDYNTEEFRAIAAVNSALGGVSLLACLLVIGLIFLFKKYLFFTQRLILYLTIAASLNTLAMLTEAAIYYPQTGAFKAYCVLSAFFQQVAGWSQVFAITCITIDLFLRAVLNYQTSRLCFEGLYIFTIFVLPLLFNWIPFLYHTYDLDGPWCWIRTTKVDEYGNCVEHTFGVVLSVVLWYGPIYPLLLILTVIYISILITIWHRRNRYEGKYNPESQIRKKLMLDEVRPLLWYPLIFFIIEIFPLMNRIYNIAKPNENNMVFWWLQALIVPLEGGLIAVVYALDPETRKRLRWSVIKVYFIECFDRKGKIEDYNFQNEGMTDSLLSEDNSMSVRKQTQPNKNQDYGAIDL